MHFFTIKKFPLNLPTRSLIFFFFFFALELFLVFIEIKHKIDLDATYFKLHLTIIKFSTLEISSELSGGFTYVPF